MRSLAWLSVSPETKLSFSGRRITPPIMCCRINRLISEPNEARDPSKLTTKSCPTFSAGDIRSTIFCAEGLEFEVNALAGLTSTPRRMVRTSQREKKRRNCISPKKDLACLERVVGDNHVHA